MCFVLCSVLHVFRIRIGVFFIPLAGTHHAAKVNRLIVRSSSEPKIILSTSFVQEETTRPIVPSGDIDGRDAAALKLKCTTGVGLTGSNIQIYCRDLITGSIPCPPPRMVCLDSWICLLQLLTTSVRWQFSNLSSQTLISPNGIDTDADVSMPQQSSLLVTLSIGNTRIRWK